MRGKDIRTLVRQLKNQTVEVAPGLWVAPELVGPNGTVLLSRQEWAKMQELARTISAEGNSATNATRSSGNRR